MDTQQVDSIWTERVVTRSVGGQQFALRRPSRADNAQIWRLYTQKLTISGALSETDLLNALDGDNLLWEARLGVLLVPYRDGRGQVLNRGETAPANWLEEALDFQSKPTGEKIVSFADVAPQEFDAVCQAFEDVFAEKKKERPMPERSTGSAGEQTSG